MTTYLGRVVRAPYAVGSKSEHVAVLLETDEGAWPLRRVGANPFTDDELATHVGMEVEVEGRLHRGVLFVERIAPRPDGP
jgi:hypothetical protein